MFWMFFSLCLSFQRQCIFRMVHEIAFNSQKFGCISISLPLALHPSLSLTHLLNTLKRCVYSIPCSPYSFAVILHKPADSTQRTECFIVLHCTWLRGAEHMMSVLVVHYCFSSGFKRENCMISTASLAECSRLEVVNLRMCAATTNRAVSFVWSDSCA